MQIIILIIFTLLATSACSCGKDRPPLHKCIDGKLHIRDINSRAKDSSKTLWIEMEAGCKEQ